MQSGKLLLIQPERDALLEVLEQIDYTICVSGNTEHSLSLIQSERFDIVLVNADLPEVKDGSLIQTLRSRAKHLPILGITNDLDSAALLMQMGADDFIMPPYNLRILDLRIKRFIEKHQFWHTSLEISEIERDIQIGRQIQKDFLPEVLPVLPGWEIAAQFRPARQVSGDFYDSFMVANDRVALVIADVCDKGVGPAMFMALMRSFIRAFTQQRASMDWQEMLGENEQHIDPAAAAQRRRLMLSPGAVSLYNALTVTNNYVATVHANLSMFATMFVGLLDPENGRLLYINGGHNPPAIVAADGVIRQRLKPSGPAVGMFPGARFEIMEANLEPGETLMTFTDGVTDAKNEAGQRFGEAELLQILNQPGESAPHLLDRILNKLDAHIGEAAPFDDITMLAARRLP